MASILFPIIVLIHFVLEITGEKDLNTYDILDGIYEFEMEFQTVLVPLMFRNMRVYLCSVEEKIYLSLTDYKPRNGFDEFTIGIAVFDNNVNLETTDAIIIGDRHKFVDAKYILKFDDSDLKLILIYQSFMVDEIIENEYILKQVIDSENNALRIKESEKSFKCWIPYSNKEENIENMHRDGRKSIWKTNQLKYLNVYDMDIFNDNEENKGCWSWVNKNGISIEADHLGTTGGNNFNYKYKINGDLLIVDWIDWGSWITLDTRHCHKGTSIFMIIKHNEAVGTFTCSDEITGSQMIMYKQPLSENLNCPLFRKVSKRNNDKTEL